MNRLIYFILTNVLPVSRILKKDIRLEYLDLKDVNVKGQHPFPDNKLTPSQLFYNIPFYEAGHDLYVT